MDEAETMVKESDPAYAGQAHYTPESLRLYDFRVFRVNYPFLYRCSSKRLVELYDRYASKRHLDIGVGSGYLIDHGRFPTPEPQITLMDLNLSSIAFATERLRRYAPRTHQANVLTPWGLPARSFDSVGMLNLLHCLPGTMVEKAVAFDHARDVLAPGGCLFGATVLGKGVKQGPLSRRWVSFLNSRGMFDNQEDGAEDLDAALARSFDSHEVTVEGCVAIFSARVEG